MKFLYAIAWLACLGCGSELQLNLIINDPCNQGILSDPSLGLQHIEVELASPSLAEAEGTVWSRADGKGELKSLTPVSDATVSVVGRGDSGAGVPGAAVAAIGVGLVDLTGVEGNVVDLDLVFGRVDTFFNTTDAAAASGGDVVCTGLLAARHGHTATRMGNGKVFIAGGVRENPTSTTYWQTTEIFDPQSGLFDGGPEMAWVRKAHTATLLEDGRILLAGGIGLSDGQVQYWRVALIYDPALGGFLEPVIMKEQRANHTATLLADGRVLLAGGTMETRDLQTTEIFDPASMSFCQGPSLSSQARAFHAAVRVGPSQVALVGGQGSGAPLGLVQFVNVAGCSQGTVTAGPTLQTPRSYPSAVLIPGDAILVAGGFNGVVTAPEDGTGITSVEIVKLNPQNLGASTVECGSLQLTAPRGAATAAPLPGGGAVVVGGIGMPGQALASVERILVNDLGSCSATIAWTAVGLSTGRARPEVTPLLGGDLLVTGGFAMDGSTATSQAQAEIYVRPR